MTHDTSDRSNTSDPSKASNPSKATNTSDASLSLADRFGQIDIYLFDQLLRGRITPGMKVFDAGCGAGRNLIYLMREGYDVYGADTNPAAIAAVRQLAAALAPRLPAENFRAEPLDRLSFPEAFADVVVSSAVLHFAENDEDFEAMLHSTWRMLKPGGLFFCRLASLTGIGSDARPLGHGRYLLPDGSERYLIDDDRLIDLTERLNATLLDPIKTTVVHAQRAMTTWVARKRR
jgi:tellurite methyltransferase